MSRFWTQRTWLPGDCGLPGRLGIQVPGSFKKFCCAAEHLSSQNWVQMPVAGRQNKFPELGQVNVTPGSVPTGMRLGSLVTEVGRASHQSPSGGSPAVYKV